jgi:hypothetical protein
LKNSVDTIGNRTRDLPAFSAVPQPTASSRASSYITWQKLNDVYKSFYETLFVCMWLLATYVLIKLIFKVRFAERSVSVMYVERHTASLKSLSAFRI